MNYWEKNNIDFCALLVPIIFKICQICIKQLPQFWCFLGALRKTKHNKQQQIYQNMQRKSSILGPNIVDFGTHFDISSFPGPNMQHTHKAHLLFDRQTTDFLLKNGPQNWPKIS